jgi:hypothetical protein
LIKLIPKHIINDVQKPFNLTIVADVSGSMQGQKIMFMKKAIIQLLGKLEKDDRLTLITYSDECELPFVNVSPVDKYDEVVEKVNSLESLNGTNIYKALRTVYKHYWKNYQENAINQIFFFSDGQATSGKITQNTILLHEHRKLIHHFTQQGQTVYFYDGYFMKGLSDNAKGGFYYISDGENIMTCIMDGLKVASAVTSNQNKITIDMVDRNMSLRLHSPNGFKLSGNVIDCGVIYDNIVYLLLEFSPVVQGQKLMTITYEGQHNNHTEQFIMVNDDDSKLGHFKQIVCIVTRIEQYINDRNVNDLRKILNELESLEKYPELKPMIDRYYEIVNAYLNIAAHVPGMLNLSSVGSSGSGDLYTTSSQQVSLGLTSGRLGKRSQRKRRIIDDV